MTHPPLSKPLARYASLLRASPHNLLSRRALEDLEARHLPECVAFARELPQTGRVVDVGSGGGLPGLVVAMVRPEMEVTLVESVAKKAAFLEQAAAELGLDVEVRRGRIEELGAGELAGRFSLATARAVAPLDRLVGWVLPVLAPGGQLWAIKGASWERELADAGAALARIGARHVRTLLAPQLAVESREPAAPTVVIIARDP